MLSKIQYLIHFSAVVIGTLMSREKLIPKITAYHIDSILWECSDFFSPTFFSPFPLKSFRKYDTVC